jgi:nitrite reductase (NAD(P)H)
MATIGCRYGVGDSVGLAVQLEKRYRGVRSPHKFKGGVSGCVRECAEAQSKDFGVIATDKGWNSKHFISLRVVVIDRWCSFRWRKWRC